MDNQWIRFEKNSYAKVGNFYVNKLTMNGKIDKCLTG